MISKRLKNEERNFELIKTKERDKIFGELNNYIKYILEFLWKNPYLISEILSNSDIKDIKKYLAHFFTLNFYDNILTNNSKEEQLLIIFTLQLKREINKSFVNNSNNDINNSLYTTFLNETPVSFMFEELFYKKEILYFFKPIIIDLIKELESGYPCQAMEFNPILIRDSILHEGNERNKTKNEGKEYDENIIVFRKSIFKKDKNMEEKLKLFSEKYMFGISKEELEKISKNYDNQDMINYINEKILNCSNNPFIYLTSFFLEHVNFDKNTYGIREDHNDEERKKLSQNILAVYQQSYFQCTKIIDKLINSFINNIHLMPYPIKCINKIIFSLINKKYPDFPKFKKNAFISRFFFNKLFFTMLLNPSIYALINDFIISDNTIINLTNIISIINKFVSGKFYTDTNEEGQYSPLNWYFLNNMPKLFEFFDKAANVDLPDCIKKIIDNDLEIEFDYFKENKEEMMVAKNILFSFYDFYYLYMNMERNKDILFNEKNEKTKILRKAIMRLRDNEYKIDKIKKYLEKPKEKNINEKTIEKLESNEFKPDSLKFFLISELLFNDKCANLFNLKNSKEYYYIEEHNLKNIENKVIIKEKNFICSFLYNYYSLGDIELNLKKEDEFNSLNILKKLKNYRKSYNLLRHENIPHEWYIDSIIEYYKKLPEKYIENDYCLLYEELENEIKNSIKLYNFEEISLLADKSKFLQNSHIFYEEAKKILIDIDLNKRLQIIIEKEIIPMEIKFIYTDKKKLFEITPISSSITEYFSPLKYFGNYEKKTCQTINQFTSIFPDLKDIIDTSDIIIFDLMNELEIPKKLNEYFNYIEKILKKSEKVNSTEIKDIKIKIYDYVMEKLYDKLFPDEPDENDLLILRNCYKASWVELKHLIKGKDDYILENFIPDTNIYFQQIIEEKSPRKKLLYMNKIFNCIVNLGLLNGDKLEGTDETLSILNYAFIKNKPWFIYTNCKYMKLFIGNKKNLEDGHQLSQLIGICQQMLNFNYKCLIGITEEEFNKNCESVYLEEK